MADPNYSNVAVDNNGGGGDAAGGDNKAAGGGVTGNAHANAMNDFFSPGYKEHLFGCQSDMKGCALSCCCPCIVTAAAKANYDERGCSYLDCICAANGYQIRQTTRSKYKIPYNPVKDCLAFCCCGPCALHQEVREIAQRSGKPPVFMMEATI